MAWVGPLLNERRSAELEDHRSLAERDRDRVLHCEYFWRLAEISQVTVLSKKQLVHNRLTHSLEVAQIAVRIAQRIKRVQALDACAELREAIADIDESACEVGALCHDLGHPPFGHVGEDVLQKNTQDAKTPGYEGNAQSFRILTFLAQRRLGDEGLNLSRRSLNAVLKYPWTRPEGDGVFKYGAYEEDLDVFNWVRIGLPPDFRTIEAQIMDVSDDIAYGVHDLLDFYKSGIIPLDRLCGSDMMWEEFVRNLDLRRTKRRLPAISPQVKSEIRDILATYIARSYDGTFFARKRVYSLHSVLFKKFIEAFSTVKLDDNGYLSIEEDPRDREALALLKEMTGHFVHRNPELMIVRNGLRKVVESVITGLSKEPDEDLLNILPARYAELFRSGIRKGRVIADFISGLTENQLFIVHDKLCGDWRTSAFD